MYKVANEKEYARLVSSEKLQSKNRHVLVQELLDMDRDLRVILIGDEIVLHYWRINTAREWKPTSTKHGSLVDFDYFPEQWREHIVSEFNKLNIQTGAFDLVWENNDYNMEPYFLEVSPSYQPNPEPPGNLKQTYGQYKARFQARNGWDEKFIKTLQKIKNRLVEEYNI